jgi:hypothetical protein
MFSESCEPRRPAPKPPASKLLQATQAARQTLREAVLLVCCIRSSQESDHFAYVRRRGYAAILCDINPLEYLLVSAFTN